MFWLFHQLPCSWSLEVDAHGQRLRCSDRRYTKFSMEDWMLAYGFSCSFPEPIETKCFGSMTLMLILFSESLVAQARGCVGNMQPWHILWNSQVLKSIRFSPNCSPCCKHSTTFYHFQCPTTCFQPALGPSRLLRNADPGHWNIVEPNTRCVESGMQYAGQAECHSPHLCCEKSTTELPTAVSPGNDNDSSTEVKAHQFLQW